MIITPRKLGFICTTAHPIGCAYNVRDQIRAATAARRTDSHPQRVLIIGASSGYGLAARITAAFACNASTVGVFLEKPGKRKRCASAGWYNAAAFAKYAQDLPTTHVSINADAFADATITQCIEHIRHTLGGPLDRVIYSLAAPARRMPDGHVAQAVIKPIGQPFTGKTIDMDSGQLVDVSLAPASAAEIAQTTAVMGGDAWQHWITRLQQAGCLAPTAQTVAMSYIGPRITWPIYHQGTIGRAKQHLQTTARALNQQWQRPGFARVAMLQAAVTQASAAIPVIPLYWSILRDVMRRQGTYESMLQQQLRLFAEHLQPSAAVADECLIRLDEHELDADIQQQCEQVWARITPQNLHAMVDFAAYEQSFLNLFGFARSDVDYTQDSDPIVDFL